MADPDNTRDDIPENTPVKTPEKQIDLSAIRTQMDALRNYVAGVESEAKAARQEAHDAHDEIMNLRDQVAAAQRDQQELKTARAKLARTSLTSVIAHLFGRSVGR